MEIEAVVNPKDAAEESLGTDKTKINILKADAKPKIELQKELEGLLLPLILTWRQRLGGMLMVLKTMRSPIFGILSQMPADS